LETSTSASGSSSIFWLTQRNEIAWQHESMLGRRVALLGLAFKPDTDDVREAASLDLIALLQQQGVQIAAYDPEASENARAATQDVSFCTDAYGAAEGADAVVLVTEWDEFRNLSLIELESRMRGNVMIDGRNLYDPAKALAAGFDYVPVGRSPLIKLQMRPAGPAAERAPASPAERVLEGPSPVLPGALPPPP
jgi:UDP-N-acetyl-D-mannosaminuronate dehydrogenase